MPSLHSSWQEPLNEEIQSDYMAAMLSFLNTELAAEKIIYPPEQEWFRALALTPLDKVRVVILGQDPYHGQTPDGKPQAHGLAFSVQHGVRPPPSLVNIYKELETDLGVTRAPHGFLEHWADQGVLLLNSVLTVEAHKAASHKGKGWERFTDAIIQLINAQQTPVVFMLWGAYAQKKAAFVDEARHLVLRAAHPSPLSAYNGFFGCRHFSKCNAFLIAHELPAIDWTLP